MRSNPSSRAGSEGKLRPVSTRTRPASVSVPYTNSDAARGRRRSGGGVRMRAMGERAEMVVAPHADRDAARAEPGESVLQLREPRVAQARGHGDLESRAPARAQRV